MKRWYDPIQVIRDPKNITIRVPVLGSDEPLGMWFPRTPRSDALADALEGLLIELRDKHNKERVNGKQETPRQEVQSE